MYANKTISFIYNNFFYSLVVSHGGCTSPWACGAYPRAKPGSRERSI